MLLEERVSHEVSIWVLSSDVAANSRRLTHNESRFGFKDWELSSIQLSLKGLGFITLLGNNAVLNLNVSEVSDSSASFS
jgi:hypothetical protein